jgi:hypothetical protein
VTKLARLVDEAVPTFGNYKTIAHAAGISLSALRRGMLRNGVLGTDALIAVAEAIGQSPDVVLKAGGKADVAARLTRLYGPPAKRPGAIDRALLELRPATKRAVLALLR